MESGPSPFSSAKAIPASSTRSRVNASRGSMGFVIRRGGGAFALIDILIV